MLLALMIVALPSIEKPTHDVESFVDVFDERCLSDAEPSAPEGASSSLRAGLLRRLDDRAAPEPMRTVTYRALGEGHVLGVGTTAARDLMGRTTSTEDHPDFLGISNWGPDADSTNPNDRVNYCEVRSITGDAEAAARAVAQHFTDLTGSTYPSSWTRTRSDGETIRYVSYQARGALTRRIVFSYAPSASDPEQSIVRLETIWR